MAKPKRLELSGEVAAFVNRLPVSTPERSSSSFILSHRHACLR